MNKGTFWLVWAVGCVPLVVSAVMYFGGVAPDGRVNRGELVPPGVVLEEWEITDASGEQWVYQGEWHLILAHGKRCDPPCEDWKQKMPNLHKALGREQRRVGWHTLSGASSDEGAMLISSRIGQIEEGIWVADPLGNLVLRFGFDQSPEALLKDLKKVLKLSKIG